MTLHHLMYQNSNHYKRLVSKRYKLSNEISQLKCVGLQLLSRSLFYTVEDKKTSKYSRFKKLELCFRVCILA